MPTLTLAPRLTLHYLDEGPAGQFVVMLLHGLGANSASWTLQVPALTAAGFRVLAPDARGFGKSTYPGGGLSVEKMAADMAALLHTVHAGSAHLVGVSMGGTLALQLALDHAQLVDKLVLVNTFARLRPERLSGWLYFARRFVLVHTLGVPVQARAVARRIFPHPAQTALRERFYRQILEADPRAYRAAMRALARFNVQRRLAEIRAPTLVITGAADTTVPPTNQRPLVAGIPGARQIIISGAGHGITVEQPAALNQALLDFL